ncbi:hypothetical protein ACU4HD_48260 [Cupriavidus basilensis]
MPSVRMLMRHLLAVWEGLSTLRAAGVAGVFPETEGWLEARERSATSCASRAAALLAPVKGSPEVSARDPAA